MFLSFALCLWTGIVRAETPRLALWVTDTLGATDARHCHLSPDEQMQFVAEENPVISEQDVLGWTSGTASLMLDPSHFQHADVARLIDHCFVLALNGMIVSSGVILSVHSARRIRFPVILVGISRESLSLQLLAEFRGQGSAPLHIEALDEILAEKRTGADSQD